jgi:small-conductance mechanosensitive channel
MASVANGMYARAGEKVVAVVMGALAVMFVCENAGLKLTGLLTSLGVSGLLVALSTQTLLQDAFASVIIAMDVPFRKNDSITLEGGVAGTVESIGLKTTYLRDFGGSLLVLPNKELCSRIIENHSKQQFRCAQTPPSTTYTQAQT